MSYVVYHKETTRFLRNHPKVRTDKTSFETEAAAKAALTREVNRGAVKREDFGVLTMSEFRLIEKTVTISRLGNGTVVKPFEQSVNAPWACNPASETYWCS